MPFAQEPSAAVTLDGGLMLLALQFEDAQVIFDTVNANREHLRQWLPWVDGSLQLSDTRKFLVDVARKREEAATLAWGLRLEGSFCGIIGLHDISLVNANVQIGYWIAKAFEGRGLMTAACRAVLAVAFDELGMERVEIRCAQFNQRSCAIPERLGFSYEGVMRHAQKLQGGFVDLRLYSLLEGEYRRR